MYQRLHVHQCFQAVGHGTFFTGVVAKRSRKAAEFSWVYDCGSKSKFRVEGVIDGLDSSDVMPNEIDMFVLSHFDNDHVNGVDHFLRQRRVRWLVMPYLDLSRRIEAIVTENANSCSSSTALFQLDPIRWLHIHGLSDQVGAVVLVKGRGTDEPPGPGPTSDPNLSRELQPRNRQGEPFQESFGVDPGEQAPSLDELMTSKTWRSSSLGISCFEIVHDSAFLAGSLPIEFKFFNSEQPSLFVSKGGKMVARKSLKLIDEIQKDVEQAIISSGIARSGTLRRTWRSDFRNLYDRHFGSTSKARNNISLCLMTRPLRPVGACKMFEGSRSIYLRPRTAHRELTRAGLLFLGDLRIDFATLRSMQAHYGASRWAELAAVQVPHHGSQHSWQPGVAVGFSPDHFIQCVPDRSGGHHPHRSVLADLRATSADVHRANGKSSVVLDYHFI